MDGAIEVIQALQDIENTCNRVVTSPLEQAIGDLRPLMSSPNQIVRNMAYMLILRHLKEHPHIASDLLPDYLDCLDNRNAAVVMSALERLPDFLLLCQGKILLNVLFHTISNDSNLLFIAC